MADRIVVEVVYAAAERQVVRSVDLPPGSRVVQAIERSGILQEVPGMDFDPSRLGIFSRRVAPDDLLRDGDRVEIYRPLAFDPKDARRRRAQG